MAKCISMSQFKSKLRQMEQKQKRAINDCNRAKRHCNTQVKKTFDAYNRFVRDYNSTVRKNKQIICREINKLNSMSNNSYSVSLRSMQQHYNTVNEVYYEGREVTPEQNRALDLIEQEHANSLITANAVENDEYPEEDTENQGIGNKLRIVSEDLGHRWEGAVFALSPQNPDATRHFCTSAREIFTEFIEMKAPDREVFSYNPQCEKTNRGNATRKEKIKYMMRNTLVDSSVIDFAEADIDNILELFYILSSGTHGAAGRYEYNKLLQVKKRVEQGINFLCEIST